jgi:hypothetical protein
MVMGLQQPEGFSCEQCPEEIPDDLLVWWVGELSDDGGLPGPDLATRVVRSLLLVACLVGEGSTLSAGVYREHLRRLVAFLESTAKQLPDPQRQALVANVVDRARRGGFVPDSARAESLEALKRSLSKSEDVSWDVVTRFANAGAGSPGS